MRSEHCGELLGDVRGTVEGTVYMCKLQRPTSESDYWRQSLCLSAGAVMSQSPGVERLTPPPPPLFCRGVGIEHRRLPRPHTRPLYHAGAGPGQGHGSWEKCVAGKGRAA